VLNTIKEEDNANNFETVSEPINNTDNTNSANNIHLISGCFSEKHNADVFVKELKSKGYSAHIVDKNKGLYRVSAQSFKNKSEAQSFKNKLSNDGYSSWILKK
jgi:cell division protein FtsN